jgi:putative methyltransferase (TIGR04325 family)
MLDFAMATAVRRFIRQLTPSILYEAYERRFRCVRFTGDYANWAAARAASTGYDTDVILRTVLAAAREVRDGRAAYERDGVAFAEPACVWPVLACLLRAAARNGGELRVLDFGGALGSLYFQHRNLLTGIGNLRWAVVEQPMFVEAGRREFTTQELSFHPDIAAAVSAVNPNVALLSGVVGWVEDPHALLAQVVEKKFRAVLLDRCAVLPGSRDRLTVQHVPATIYRASYPAWLLSRAGIVRHFATHYELTAEFRGQDAPTGGAEFFGFSFERRP